MNPSTTFYGLFLSEINKEVVTNHPYCKTACVTRNKTDINISMLFATEFIEKLTIDEKVYLTLHEILHIALEHIFGSHDYLSDKDMLNCAQDLEINSILGTKNMPEGGLHPTLYGFQENLGTNEYYKLLSDAKKKRNGNGGSNGNSQKQSTGNEKLDELIDSLDQLDLGHDLWKEIDKMSDSAKEMLKREIDSKLERCAQEVGEKEIGNLPAKLGDKLKKIFNPEPPVIDWKKAFKSFVDGSIKTLDQRTYRKENHRYEDAMGRKQIFLPKILVAIDQSGSMSDYDLEEVYSQLFHIYKTGVDVDLLPWDGHVGTLTSYKGVPIIERELGGGTNPNCVLQWLLKTNKTYSCVIIGTDGYVPNINTICKIPLLWVVTSNGNTNFQTVYRKVKINKQKQK